MNKTLMHGNNFDHIVSLSGLNAYRDEAGMINVTQYLRESAVLGIVTLKGNNDQLVEIHTHKAITAVRLTWKFS